MSASSPTTTNGPPGDTPAGTDTNTPARSERPPSPRHPVERLEMAAFARRLHALMMDKGLTQSDVASQIWGKTTNTKGHTVAKGRDRISEYVRGNSVPEPRNLRRLADVLGVTVEQLAPERAGSVLDRDDPALKMSAAAGQPGHVHLHINQTVPLGVAAEIIRLIGQSPAGARP